MEDLGLRYHREDYDVGSLDPHWADFQIAEMTGSGKTVLELGCATGYIGKYLAGERACVVDGIEVDERAAALARPHYRNVVAGDASSPETLKKLMPPYEVVICSNVLEHLVDPAAALLKLRDLLAPQGYFVVAPPNVAHWSVRLGLLFGRFDYQETGILDRTHLKFFTHKTASALLRNAGLEIVRESFDWDNGIPKLNGLITRVPLAGPALLKALYSLNPKFFGYQFVFKARRAGN